MTHFDHPKQLLDHAGEELGASDWLLIDQARINGFADDTEDTQWIHVAVERAKSGPYAATIAHGYLTLSLAPWMLGQVVIVDNVQAAVNYGMNKVRFPAPVLVDSRIRGVVDLRSATARGDSIEAVFGLIVEIEGGSRPACVAELVVLYT
jgi:acyl dehydratase